MELVLKKSYFFYFILLLLMLTLGGCIKIAPLPPPPELPTPEPAGLLTIGIESDLASLEPILAEWAVQNSEQFQTLFVTGSADQLQRQLAAGELDGIFVYQKPINASLWTLPIALDSITIIAHPALALNSLERSHLQQVFAGDIKNWETIAGQNRPISVFVLDNRSGVYTLFNERIMENRPVEVSAVVPLDQVEMLKKVAETEGGLGFLPTSRVDAESDVQVVPVDGFFPQFNTVRSQQYPLTIPVYMGAFEEPQGELRRLAAWLQSAEGQQTLATKFVQLGN